MRTYKLTKKNITEAERLLESQESITAARIANLLALEDRAEECIRIADHIAGNFDDNHREHVIRISRLLVGETLAPEPGVTIVLKPRCGAKFEICGLQQTCALQAGHPGSHISLAITERP